MKQFVCRFAQQWESFRLPELESVAKMQNVKIEYALEDYSDQVRLKYEGSYNILNLALSHSLSINFHFRTRF